ncbi:hypothetical protein QQM79_09505 [Marinobacteraceae bacterium S3BR75-40.1]
MPDALSQLPWSGSLKVRGLVTIALLIALILINQPLVTPAAPQGMISLQMAETLARSQPILSEWQGQELWAQGLLAFEFVFILSYLSFLLGLDRHLLSERPGVREQKTGKVARRLFIVGAGADALENIGLLWMLSDPLAALPLTITLLALIKFSALALGLAGLVVLRFARGHPLNEPEKKV